MSSLLAIIAAAGVGLIVGVLIAFFLNHGLLFRYRSRSSIKASPPKADLWTEIPAPPASARQHEIYFNLRLPNERTEATTFPAELSVGQLITGVVTDEKMRIHPPDPEQWSLIDEVTGEQLDPNKSLQHNGVNAGDMLTLRRAPRPEVTVAIASTRPLIRCDDGHYYDPKKHTKCPHCGGAAFRCEPGRDPGSSPEENTQPARLQIPASPGVASYSEPLTQRFGLTYDPTGIDPVVGWLVAIDGPGKGRDYRIRSENNSIGRSRDMDICISGDDSVSRERHAVITFDAQRNTFYLSPGKGRGVVLLNGEALLAPKQLAPYDEIMLGTTKLRFVPFVEGNADLATSPTPATRDSFRCSVFHPEKVGPDDVAKIIAYVHLETVASNVVRNASVKLELSPTMKLVANSETATRPIPAWSTVEVTTEVPGLLFENERASMRLWQDMQSVEFRFTPSPGIANKACCGWIHFWLAGLILADVKVTVFVADDRVPEIFREQLAQANAKPYRRVFPSYSHRDAAVVERLEIYAASFGDEYLRDVKTLRSAQLWNEELLAFIKGADVFQLFWSGEAAASEYVEKEWRNALRERESRADPFFLRPVYWTNEPAPIPSELRRLHFARIAIGK